MSVWNLRKKSRISYCETEEPALDQYVYCDNCADFVYEYCSIHGPLIVVPDDKVPKDTGLPSYVPQAALTVPKCFLHIAQSAIPGAGLGIFASVSLPRGVRFGPYRGAKQERARSDYSWQIYGADRKPCHVVDASDAHASNWMRYVNCARHSREQNLTAFQYQGEIYYRTIKVIPRFTELLVFYGAEFANILQINLRMYNSPLAGRLPYVIPKKNIGIEMGNGKDELTVPHEVSKESLVASINDSFNGYNEQLDETLIDIEFKSDAISVDSSDKSDFENTDTSSNCNDTNYSNETEYNPNVTTVGNLHSCLHCGFKRIEKPAVLKHIRSVHSEKCHKCQFCNTKFVLSSSFRDHLEKHRKFNDSDNVIKCDKCEYKTYAKRNFRKHNMKRHAGADDPSPEGNINDVTKQNQNEYSDTNQSSCSDVEYKCGVCDYKSTKRCNLTRHFKSKHASQFNCSQCEFNTDYKIKLEIHLRLHTNMELYKCVQCNYNSPHLKNYRQHIKTHAVEKNFSCHICQMKFKLGNYLSRHLKTHKMA